MLLAFVSIGFAAPCLLAQTRPIWPRLSCGIGERKQNMGANFVCLPCPGGSFMDVEDHLNTRCIPCRNYSREIDYVEELEPCTRDRDAVVRRCVDNVVNRFVHFDELKKRYYCIKCTEGDCIQRSECCNNTVPTATSTLADTLATSSLQTDTDNHNLTKCDDIVIKGCLGSDLVNKTCLAEIEFVVRSMQCQNCPKFMNMTVCSNPPHDPSLSSGLKVVIAIVIVAVLVVFALVLYLFYKRRTSRTYRTYELANRDTDSSNNKKDEQKSPTVLPPISNHNDTETEIREV